jgi:L-arabinokinase
MRTRPTIVFYISGHGFGHASRDIEVINALQARRPGARVVVRTVARRWLFDLTLKHPVERYDVEGDTGIAQIDSLHLDAHESVRRAAAFHDDLERKARAEAAFLHGARADLVVGDIPPLAFRAATLGGIPSIALGNFTWDWIYAGYPEWLAEAPRLIPAIRGAYGGARLALRLPMSGGFEAFARVIDIPFIARHSYRDPRDTRRFLGLPLDRPVVLLSFGGYGLEGFDLRETAGLGDRAYVIVTTRQVGARTAGLDNAPSTFELDERALYDAGYRYEDLVAAVDVVATKPGYGIVAECIANETAMLYTSRGRFVEYEVLVDGIRRYLRHAFISNEDLYAGRWTEPLARILAAPAPAERPTTNGADVAADTILDTIGLPGRRAPRQRG